jgi:hypothetical protein
VTIPGSNTLPLFVGRMGKRAGISILMLLSIGEKEAHAEIETKSIFSHVH